MAFKPMFLVIEDNLIDQLVMKQLLKKVLHIEQITIANNGKEGISWLKDNKRNSSLIIFLDIQMPIMNGFEFLDEFKKLNEEVKKGIQIYVLSSTLDPDDIKKIKENKHVTQFLRKPLHIEELKSRFAQ